MFDLITDTRERPLRERSLRSKLLAMVAHAIVVLGLVVIPLLRVTNQLPPVVPTMMAFVAAVPAAPPPPPPRHPATAAARPVPEAVPTTGRLAAPLDAPRDIQPEPPGARDVTTAGVLGGVEGGVPGGVVGGIVGGIVSNVPPPPPPPPPSPAAVAREPVRIGGQITAPALLHRVEPTYPEVAAIAHVTGVVILEAAVGPDGCVESVKVLRSRHVLLDKAAQEAVLQWQYSPLVLNGIPTPFVLTVTFNFSVQK